jgi:hypothetical protein
VLLAAYFFLGTLAPFSRASDSPIAIACLRLLTVPPFPPLPDLSAPFFLLCMALFTDLPAALPYFRPLDFFFELERFLVAIVPPYLVRSIERKMSCAFTDALRQRKGKAESES